MSLETQLCGHTLRSPLMNASGVYCTTEQDLQRLCSWSETSAVVSKSATFESRQGNPEPRYWGHNGYSINSMGIPNLGYTFYSDMGSKIKQWKPDTPYIVSVSSMDGVDKTTQMLQHFDETETVDMIELNVSCPNIVGKPQLGYYFEGFEEFMRKLTEKLGPEFKTPMGLKLPPYFDTSHWNSAANIVSEFNSHVQFLTCCNSFGNSIHVDLATESMVIAPKGGYGGRGGSALKDTSLANVWKFRQLLGDKVDIIGCGGVTSGTNVYEYILCGANAVQIGTQLRERQHRVFKEIHDELIEYMGIKRRKTLDEFRGKIKIIG